MCPYDSSTVTPSFASCATDSQNSGACFAFALLLSMSTTVTHVRLSLLSVVVMYEYLRTSRPQTSALVANGFLLFARSILRT
ncbi:hypothetical protein BD309DRAFT_959540 [Dichomitus squalens]|uniref:Uncharacterized protein n=1 Tax=Dichomitus squalens TaxID=114155 RepID=A0A4Q9PFG6_9APHY|nr:hypothetical protein BD309DRAFT_959540 [Dichomitus squalens]TBU53734.1 hypothetical protein BD310DRAFT_937447 [Dichomitus squalens]